MTSRPAPVAFRTLGGWLASPWRGRPLPVHPVLIAAYPVLLLYGQNLGELRLADLVGPLAGIVGLALFAHVISAYAFHDARRSAVLVSAIAATLLLAGYIGDIVRPLGFGALLQLGGWTVFLGAALVIAIRLGPSTLAKLTRAVNLVTSLLVVLALLTIVPGELGRIGGTARIAGAVSGSSGPGRDVWYLVFDRYGSARSLELLYDIDDRPFHDGLRARGFTVVPPSHANYVKTTLSLAATLNLDYLDELAAEQGRDAEDHGPIFDRLSDHVVGRFLRERGYTYVHVGSYYGPTQTSRIADRNLYLEGPSDFVAALYEASAVPMIARRFGYQPARSPRERHYATGRFQLDTLDRLADAPGPSFVFAHLLLPHPPFTFASDGSYLVDAVPAGRGRTREAYRDQLAYLQQRLDALIDRLLARPEAERPIIVLQADEGPYPHDYARDLVSYDWSTATAEDLEIKFGIFNAMYLPGGDPPEIPPTVSSVNTFRIILGHYFDADLPLLPDRSYTSAGKFRPYDLTDITDRLPRP